MDKYVYVDAEDFEAIYKNGKLMLQDNGIEVSDLVDVLGWKRVFIPYTEKSQVWVDGTFPDNLEDLKIEQETH